MTRTMPGPRHVGRRPARRAIVPLAALLLAGCGGGGNPLGNPPDVNNSGGVTGQKLSFIYFQKCINPIFQAQLQININGVISTNSCAGSGCHDNANGTGGAFRVLPSATQVDLANAANTPDVVRASDMYKNFYSAQGEVIPGSPATSRLVNKPQVLGVLHGGGLIFANDQDPNVKLLQYWISHPSPQGQDEFSVAGNSMFTPADPATGSCNTQ
ncbi:hypothetical protein [Methylibium sp.]|uniref:hypothetical protein n=1 Tax=Methylibium sp. TaxID=2067992 RepID=UPI003D0BD7D7